MAQGTTVPGSGLDPRDDEERALVAELMSAGKTGAEIQAALDDHRANGRDGSQSSRESNLPPIQQLPPEQLRFSQRTAGGNGRADRQREFVRNNKQITSPVDAVRTPDGVVTIDNTRVAVAREHGLMTIPVRIWEPTDLLPPDMSDRFEGLRT